MVNNNKGCARSVRIIRVCSVHTGVEKKGVGVWGGGADAGDQNYFTHRPQLSQRAASLNSIPDEFPHLFRFERRTPLPPPPFPVPDELKRVRGNLT